MKKNKIYLKMNKFGENLINFCVKLNKIDRKLAKAGHILEKLLNFLIF